MAKRTYNRRGRQTAKTPVTSSKRRPQRIKGAQTARRTGSPDKMTVSGQRKITGGPRGAQGPANPPVQGPSRPTPTAIGGDTGRRGGPNQPARSGPPRPAGPTASRVARQLTAAGTIINPRSDVPAKVAAAASLVAEYMGSRKPKPKNKTKKGTDKDNRPSQGAGLDMKRIKAEDRKAKTIKSFDAAFAAARKAGKKTFTWRGKSYHTRMKGK